MKTGDWIQTNTGFWQLSAARGSGERPLHQPPAKLAGVKVKMASAILTAMFPMLYTVCDFRASHALGVKDHSSLCFYVHYLAAGREMAAQYGSPCAILTGQTGNGRKTGIRK